MLRFKQIKQSTKTKPSLSLRDFSKLVSDFMLIDGRRCECIGEDDDRQQRQQQQSRAGKERHGNGRRNTG